jgi:glycosyltransferase involved in cell wall biosynthesis
LADPDRARILFAYPSLSRFVELDRALLAERWQIEDWPKAGLRSLARLARAVRRSRLVFAWFATSHAVAPVTLAWLLRRPCVIVVGGVDLANLPEINYGYQQSALRRLLARWVISRATRLVTNSEFSRQEAVGIGLAPGDLTVIYHGVPDDFGPQPPGERAPVVLTVGVVDARNLERKGLRAFVEAARLVPDMRFVLVGGGEDNALDALRARAADNVELTGWVSDAERDRLMLSASVYVQASLHEGFGMSVAEAMLAGCIPVVTDAGALPEVVGDTGIVLEGVEPEQLADGIRRARALGAAARGRARSRALNTFPLERRGEGLRRVVAEALGEAA